MARRPHPEAWDETEDQRLAELCGHHTPPEIAEILNAELHRGDGIHRTPAAITVRQKRKGLSRWMHGYRLNDVECMFHFDHRGIHHNWLEPGLLVPTRTFNGRGGDRQNYVFTDQDLERFVRGYPWAYDYRRIETDLSCLPSHVRAIAARLRTLGELAWRRDPYLTRDEFCAWMGWQSWTPWKTWALERGLVPYRRRRHSIRHGSTSDGEVLVRASELPTIAEAIALARSQHRRDGQRQAVLVRPQNQPGYRPRPRTLRHRCPCGALIIWCVDEPWPLRCAFCGEALQQQLERVA